jgi:rhodanese-related sulfurtransferase
MLNRNAAKLTAATLLGLVIFAGGALAQSRSIYQATLAETNSKTQEVSTEQLRHILADGSAVVVDARPRKEYVAGHIPDARSLEGPASAHLAEVERMVNGDKSKALVLYCNGPFCQASKRLADQLVGAGFTDVRRYQLGMPIWRALGGPTVIELEGIVRIFKVDQTAVYFDARSAEDFAQGSLAGAHNMPAGKFDTHQLPSDDFNRRIVLFGRDAAQARALADGFSKKPWHNVSYFPGSFEALIAAVGVGQNAAR